MNLAEKFRFLADRAEDGQPFYFGEQEMPKVFINGKLHSHNANGTVYGNGLKLRTIQENELSLKRQTPIYYAKVKGWKLLEKGRQRRYWAYVIEDTEIGETNSFDITIKSCADKMTKSEWEKLGINDTNADFERVDEE